jgi:formate dehydrogenase major subunit
VPGLGASFGRGAATTFLGDLATSDCILVMGSNMAEAHPVGFRFALQAREKGAALIHVDPRFTRTSAMATQHVPIRAGSDIAFLGGIINYIFDNRKWFHDYVVHYTNAGAILSESFVDSAADGGLFPGFNSATHRYDGAEGVWGYTMAADGRSYETDPSLEHPRCVFQVVRRHFARYTPEAAASACGCTPADIVNVAELLCRNSGRERTSAIVYALGWTQHSTGVQMIRAAAIIQLLLGNIGRPGGGIMAMRGHCSIQGSTDIPTLYHSLPGYLPQPAATPQNSNLTEYLKHGVGYASSIGCSAAGFWNESAHSGYWANMPAFFVSLLKSWYGDAATSANDYGFDWLPKVDGDYSELSTFVRMYEDGVRGLLLIGQNPAAGAPNAELNRAAMRKLDWLVVQDWFEHESANFWYADPRAGDPESIKTEVFFMPAAAITEKEGTFTNTERLIQWHDKACDPPDDCRSDAWFFYHLGLRLKRMYADSTLERDSPIRNLTWDYHRDHPEALSDGSTSRMADEPDSAGILKEINGRDAKGKLIRSAAELRDDGSTSCGAWIYAGVYPEEDLNRARSRNPRKSGNSYPDWGFAWPANRRTMYNRASADPAGNPWSDRKRLVWWDETNAVWTGDDTPDFDARKPPTYRPDADGRGMDALAGDAPFIMNPDGRGWLYAPYGVKDGPLPIHFEPRESVIANPFNSTQSSPTLNVHSNELNRLAHEVDPDYPVIATTFRLTEHYLSGPMSRFNSWLNELQPEMFVELGLELADQHGIVNGGYCIVSTARGSIEARALVTPRLHPLRVAGQTIHQIGLPIHWGYAGETVGAIANDLTALVTDANVSMHEAKAFTCAIRAGRLSAKRTASPVYTSTRPFGEAPIPGTPDFAQPEGRQQSFGVRRRRK